MIIHEKHRMGDAIVQHYKIIPLLRRFEINFGFGEKTIEEVCESSGINTSFFLEIINSYINADYVARNDFSLFPLSVVVKYLRQTHVYYLNVGLPNIEEQIKTLINMSELSDEKKSLVINFFDDYKKDFVSHIMKEEEEVLPYILELEKHANQPKISQKLAKRIKESSIVHFDHEHEGLDESLANLATLIIKFLPPFMNRELCDQILADLFSLKEDLIDHAIMEDRVLIPKVSDLEKELLQRVTS